METNYSLLFYLKKPKSYTTGPIPIYMRITVNAPGKEVSTGRECDLSARAALKGLSNANIHILTQYYSYSINTPLHFHRVSSQKRVAGQVSRPGKPMKIIKTACSV